MPYVLTRIILGQQPELGLSESDFAAIVEAKRGLFAALWVEEKLGIVLENYAAFERALLEQSLQQAIFREWDHSAFQDRLYAAARHLSNLLSSCRAYIDQTHGDLTEIYQSNLEMVCAIKGAFSEEYDARLGYRAMEALRNFSQHRSLPLHAIGTTHDRVDSATPSRRILSVPKISVKRLEEDQKFKTSVLAELKAIGEPALDLRPFLRDYMQGIAVAHGKVRRLMESDLARWEATLAAQISRWREEATSDIGGLAAVYKNDDGEEELEEGIFEEFMDRRRELVKRHQHAEFVGRAFVSNEERRR